MKKFILFGIRSEDEKQLANNWAENNDVKMTFVEAPLTMENVHLAEGHDGLSCSQNIPTDSNVYAEIKKYGINQIAQRSTGYDSYNLKDASENQIIITNVPSYSPESIAEYALGATLYLVRKFNVIDEKVKSKDFRWIKDIRAGLINEMTVGIIGTGNIGMKAARLFKALGAKVIAYDVYPNSKNEDIVEYKKTVEEIVENSDIISLHSPATKENHHLFNEEMFNKFKPSAYLINAARGALVDTKALLNALDSGKLAGAALDTYEGESGYIPKDNSESGINDEIFNQIINHDKILFTPHIAFYTNVSERNIMNIAMNSVVEVLETGDSKNRVN